MFRRFLLVVTLTTSVHLLGQNAPSGSTNTATPVPGTGYVINGGYVTTAGNGQLVTPQAAYGTPAPTAGISNGDRAGISNNAPISSNLAPTAPQVIGVIENAPAVPVGPIGTNTENTSNPNATSEESRGPANDLGPSYFLPGEPGVLSPEASLGEVAAQYRAKHNANAHVYTNADIAQLRNQSTGIVIAAKLTPPPAASSSQQAAPATTQTQRSAPAATIAQAQPPAPGPQQQAPSTSSPQSSTPSQQGNTGTTPQINQPPANSSKEDTRRLPATSTFLPLLGLLGLASGGLGLWFRRRRS
jgi:LPXTG-motif cell wall-anchored protein